MTFGIRWLLCASVVAAMGLSGLRHGACRRAGLQEPRPARHALLRRQQGSRRRRADRSEQMERPVDAGLRLHAGRRSGRLCQHLQAVHRPSRDLHRQARRLLSGAVELGRDRGDALGPPACRRLLDRPDRLCRQPRRRGPVRRQGHREGRARLQPDRDGRRRRAPIRSSPISRARRSRIPRRRRTPAISRRACCFRRKGLTPDDGLQAADVGRSRQVDARRRLRRLRHGARVASDVYERMVVRGTIKERRLPR